MTDELDEPMTGPDDDALMARLRAVAQQMDPVPDHLVLAARSQLAYLRLDAELAELVHDSVSAAGGVAAGVRSPGDGVRMLSFETGALQIEVEVVPDRDRYRLIGQCLPPAEVEVQLRSRARSSGSAGAGGATPPAADREPDGDAQPLATTTSDELGRFTLEAPAGAFSLRASWAHLDRTVETSWVSV